VQIRKVVRDRAGRKISKIEAMCKEGIMRPMA
jgi:hypothetical protein